MPNYPKISLQTASLTPATYQAAVFTPKEQDMSLLQRSMATLDERKENTDKQRAALRTALGQVKLNAAEDAWKYDYINRISKQIDNAAQFGDYATALEVATNLAGEATTSPELLGRVRANEQYEKELTTQQTRRDKGEISQNTYNWWLKNNPYTYQDVRDDNGNIIGGSTYEPKFRPVNDINWASTAMAAFKMVSPYKNSTSTDGSTSVSNNTDAPLTRGGKTYAPGESISSSGHSSSSVERVTKDQIVASMEELLKSTPDGYRQAEQAYDVAMDEFNSMINDYDALIAADPNSKEAKALAEKIEVRKKLMYKNGSPIDYKEYYARMVTDSLFAKGLAYDWRSSSSGGSSSYSISDRGSSGGGQGGVIRSTMPIPGGTYNITTGYFEKAPDTRQEVNGEQYQTGVTQSSTNIASRFKNKGKKQ